MATKPEGGAKNLSGRNLEENFFATFVNYYKKNYGFNHAAEFFVFPIKKIKRPAPTRFLKAF